MTVDASQMYATPSKNFPVWFPYTKPSYCIDLKGGADNPVTYKNYLESGRFSKWGDFFSSPSRKSRDWGRSIISVSYLRLSSMHIREEIPNDLNLPPAYEYLKAKEIN